MGYFKEYRGDMRYFKEYSEGGGGICFAPWNRGVSGALPRNREGSVVLTWSIVKSMFLPVKLTLPLYNSQLILVSICRLNNTIQFTKYSIADMQQHEVYNDDNPLPSLLVLVRCVRSPPAVLQRSQQIFPFFRNS